MTWINIHLGKNTQKIIKNLNTKIVTNPALSYIYPIKNVIELLYTETIIIVIIINQFQQKKKMRCFK